MNAIDIGRFRDVVFFDTEYEALPDDTPVLPRLVCVQYCTLSDPRSRILGVEEAEAVVRAWLLDDRLLLVGLATHVDTAILGRTYGLEREIWAAYEARRVSDCAIREKMIDLARPGELMWSSKPSEDETADPEREKVGRRFRRPVKLRWDESAQRPTGCAKSSYKMSAIWKRRTGEDISADKGADSWRMRYIELLGVPVEEWPEEARRYAEEDATRTREIWLRQVREARPVGAWEHLATGWWEILHPADGAPLLQTEPRTVHYAYSLQLISGAGFPVDSQYARAVSAEYAVLEEEARAVLRETGILAIRADRVTVQAARKEGDLTAEEEAEIVALEEEVQAAEAYLESLPLPVKGPTYKEVAAARRAAKAAHEGAKKALRAVLLATWDPGEREVIDRKILVQQALAALSEHPKIPAGLTKTGREKHGECEKLPLAAWPEEARLMLDTSGPGLRGVVGARGDDARLLAKDAAAARAWGRERIAAALRDCDYPGLLAVGTAVKARALGVDMVGPLHSIQIARPRFDPLLNTGRISLLGTIRQNMPRKGGVRECFVPPPGHALIVADFAQIELVAFAYMCDRSVEAIQGYPVGTYSGPLSRAINAGLDCHLLLGLELLPEDVRARCTYEAAERAGLLAPTSGRVDLGGLRKVCGALVDEHGGSVPRARAARPELDWVAFVAIEAARQSAKSGNFGFPGGMTAPTFARTQTRGGNPMTVDFAQFLFEVWVRRWEPADYFALVRRWVDGAGKGRPPLGAGLQVPVSGLVVGGRSYCQTANILFQSPAAEGFRRALQGVQRRGLYGDPSDPLWGVVPRLPVHDEIVATAPVERAAEALAAMRAEMEAQMGTAFPGMRISTSGNVLPERWRKT